MPRKRKVWTVGATHSLRIMAHPVIVRIELKPVRDKRYEILDLI